MATNERTKFRKAFQARTKGKFAAAKKIKPKKFLDVPGGKYLARYSRGIMDVDRNGDPFVQFRFVIHHDNPKFGGQVGAKTHFISPPKFERDPKGRKYTKEELEEMYDKTLQYLSEDFQRLLDKEIKDMSDDEIMDAIEELNETKPWIKITVKPKIDKESGKPDLTKEPTVYINGLARDEEIPEDSESGEEETEESSEDDEEETEGEEASGDDDEGGDEEEAPEDYDNEDDAEEAEEDDDEEEQPVGKKSSSKPAAKPASGKTAKKPGQKTSYKGGSYTIKSITNGKATLVASNGKLLKNVPVEKLG